MRTLIVLDDVDELLAVASDEVEGVRLPAGAKLIFEDNFNRARLQADGFEFVARDDSVDDLIRGLVRRVGLDVHIT